MAGGSTMAGRTVLLVVDASVAVKFVAEEPGSAAAYDILTGPTPLIAPDWVLVEVASALWKHVKFSLILETHAHERLDALPEMFARLFSTEPLLKEAFELSFRLRHPVYDCLYLALARRERVRLITADKDFYQASKRNGGGEDIDLLTW